MKTIFYKLKLLIPQIWLIDIIVGFVLWSMAFISSTSFIGIDGKRYFCLFDDAMISMRYAWNFSHGNGLVWNQGEHIEGITNLLFTLYMSIWTLLFSKPMAVLAVQITGIIIMLGIAFISMRIGDIVYQNYPHVFRDLLKIMAFFCALLYYPLTYWSLMGMETGLISLLILTAAWLAIRNKGQITIYAIPILLGLAFMTRPDTIVQIALIFIYQILIAKRKIRRVFIINVVILAIFIIGTSLFRLAYYGSVVPNTYTLKMTGMELRNRLSNGYGFVKIFLTNAWLPLLFGLLSTILIRRLSILFLFLIIASSILYQIWIGGDPWPY